MLSGFHPWHKGNEVYLIEEVKVKMQNKTPFCLPININ